MNFQFRLRHILVATLLTGVYFAVRDKLTLFQLYFLPPAFALVVTLFGCLTESRLGWKAGAIAGAISAGGVALLACIEVAEHFRITTDGEYWTWSRDWPELIPIVLGETCLGAAVGGCTVLLSKAGS